MKKRNGFTLIELLATVVVLSIILGITGYVAVNAINRAKDKSYKVTTNEIEKNSGSYLSENSNRLFFLTDNIKQLEYQCITVENLVDYGYLNVNITNSKVSKDKTVEIADYIYIERDIDTKSITKAVYNFSSSEVDCAKAMNAEADIAITSVPSLNQWSRYKDITIKYRLKNLNDLRSIDEYEFNHSYSASNEYNANNDTFESNVKIKYLKVLANGELTADIKKGSNTTASTSVVIDKIDIVGPVIEMDKSSYKGDSKVRHTVTIPLKVSDYGIGINHTTFNEDDIEVMVGSSKVTDIKLTKVSDTKYNLVINSDLYNGLITLSIAKNKVFDKLENGNNEVNIDTKVTFDNKYKIIYDANGGSGAPGVTEYTYDKSGTVKLSSTKPTRTGYTFLGWSTNKSATTATYTAGAAYSKNIMEDVTLYAVWVANYYLDVNGMLDGNSVGNVSGYGTFDVYIDGKLVADDVNDYYKQHPYGTKYEVKDIKNTKGRTYNGIYSGSASGAMTGTTSVYLKYTSNTYYIYYKANGGSGVPNTQSYKYATSGTINLSSTKPTRTGYTFLGWSQSSDASSASYSAGQAWQLSNAKNYILYAVWKISTVTVSFNAGDGSGAPGPISYIYDPNGATNCVELPMQTPSRSGFSFGWWSTGRSGGESYHISRRIEINFSSGNYYGAREFNFTFVPTNSSCKPGFYVNYYPRNINYNVVLYPVWIVDEPPVKPNEGNGCDDCYCCCNYCPGENHCWPDGC